MKRQRMRDYSEKAQSYKIQRLVNFIQNSSPIKLIHKRKVNNSLESNINKTRNDFIESMNKNNNMKKGKNQKINQVVNVYLQKKGVFPIKRNKNQSGESFHHKNHHGLQIGFKTENADQTITSQEKLNMFPTIKPIRTQETTIYLQKKLTKKQQDIQKPLSRHKNISFLLSRQNIKSQACKNKMKIPHSQHSSLEKYNDFENTAKKTIKNKKKLIENYQMLEKMSGQNFRYEAWETDNKNYEQLRSLLPSDNLY